MTSHRNKWLILISFSIVFGWIMSFPYQGPIMYALAGEQGLNGIRLNTLTVFSHFLGLFCGRFINRTIEKSRRNIIFAILTMLIMSAFLPVVAMDVWLLLIPLVSFVAGIPIVSFASLINAFVPIDERTKLGGGMLILGNVLLVFAHSLTINTRPMIGFVFIEVMLVIALVLVLQIDFSPGVQVVPLVPSKKKVPLTQYWIFFLFIFVTSINSGIMFQVIYPYFSNFSVLTSIYTNIPYILVILFLTKVIKLHKLNTLYVGLALWGLTFVVFAFASATAINFVLICTVMLAACGIFDFFWWSIMVNNFVNIDKPSSLFGLGLSLNVLGVWVGGVMGNVLLVRGINNTSISFMGIVVILMSMLIILPLNNRLSDLLASNDFVIRLSKVEAHKKDNYMTYAQKQLTDREYEVFTLLIDGEKDREICEQLHISQNTTKTHNRNIYKKLQVSSRIELIDKMSM